MHRWVRSQSDLIAIVMKNRSALSFLAWSLHICQHPSCIGWPVAGERARFSRFTSVLLSRSSTLAAHIHLLTGAILYIIPTARCVSVSQAVRFFWVNVLAVRSPLAQTHSSASCFISPQSVFRIKLCVVAAWALSAEKQNTRSLADFCWINIFRGVVSKGGLVGLSPLLRAPSFLVTASRNGLD